MPSLRLGDIAPDFEQDSSLGRIRFHEWLGSNWGVLFSHPRGFHARVHHRARAHGQLSGQFAARGVKVMRCPSIRRPRM